MFVYMAVVTVFGYFQDIGTLTSTIHLVAFIVVTYSELLLPT